MCNVKIASEQAMYTVNGIAMRPVMAVISGAWNGLPASVRAVVSLVCFRKELKTVFFWRSFD